MSECSSGRVEVMIISITLNKEKWVIISAYKQPKVKDKDIVSILVDKCILVAPNLVITGDLNINVSKKNHSLSNFLDVYGMNNLVKGPTCFKSATNPSTVDLIITNVPKRIKCSQCIETDLSDFHSMLCFATKLNVQPRKQRIVTYKSYRNFNEKEYLKDLSCIPFQIIEVFNDIEDAYWMYEKLL